MTWLVARNVFVLVAVGVLGGVYFGKYASTLPQDWIIAINFALVPASVGIATYFLFAGKVLTRLALIGAIPVLSIVLAGGDPAKPGLELVLIAPLLVVSWIGAGIALALQRLVSRSATGA